MKKCLPCLTLLFVSVISVQADDGAVAATSTNAPAIAPVPPTAPPTADAGDGKVLAPSNDQGIGSDGTVKDDTGYQVRIGELYAPGGEAYIIPIRLPKLPDGQQFGAIHLRAQLVSVNNEDGGLANADLYGLGLRAESKVLATDYYQGAGHDPKATLLQANFLTPTSPVRKDALTGPFVETSADGDTALTKFFNDAYAKGANAGKFAFLRVSYDLDPIPNGNNAYQLLSSGADGDKEPPVFTYTLVPAKN